MISTFSCFSFKINSIPSPQYQFSGSTHRSEAPRLAALGCQLSVMEYSRPLGSPKAGRSFHRSIGHQSSLGLTCIISGSIQLLHNMDFIDSLLSELEEDSGLRTPSPPLPFSTSLPSSKIPPPPPLPFSSSPPSCKSPPPHISYSTSPREALQFPHLILSGTSPKELPAPSLNTSSPPPQLHCLTINAGKNFLKNL